MKTIPHLPDPRSSILAVRTDSEIPAILGVEQAAEVAGVSTRQFRRWMAAGLIPGYRMPGTTRWRIRRDELFAKMGMAESAR